LTLAEFRTGIVFRSGRIVPDGINVHEVGVDQGVMNEAD
jgi:hypothetical protein